MGRVGGVLNGAGMVEWRMGNGWYEQLPGSGGALAASHSEKVNPKKFKHQKTPRDGETQVWKRRENIGQENRRTRDSRRENPQYRQE